MASFIFKILISFWKYLLHINVAPVAKIVHTKIMLPLTIFYGSHRIKESK